MKILLFLIIFTSVYCYPQNGIYVGLKHISKFNGISSEGVEYVKNYYISQYLKTTAVNARSACKSYSKDMDLVALETREEFMKIRTKLSAVIGQDPVIVGGFAHKLNNKFDYYWISSSTKIDYTYDASRGENCLALQNEGAIGYIRINCDGSHLFICQDVEYQYAN
ncbi:unnamed protein product [Chironomus riparius]|uniref:C-type lectin domain-containing protein n=1 Tax=Chironomus riparius TaxID=315576 RepID=A0A9N9WUT1_9DIPT|nr:unnamed protein product [Chironomus riparius]